MSLITDSLTNQTSSLVFFAIDVFHSLLLFPVPRYDLETDSKILIGDSYQTFRNFYFRFMLLEKMMAEENQEPNFYPKYRKVLPPGLEVNQVSLTKYRSFRCTCDSFFILIKKRSKFNQARNL